MQRHIVQCLDDDDEPKKAIAMGNRQNYLLSRQDVQCTERAQPSRPAGMPM